MVGLVLVSHSRPLAEAVKDVVLRITGQPLPIAVAAGAGEDRSDLGTDAMEILEAIQSVLSDEGVLVLMDMGSAILSAETALEFLDEAAKPRVRCCAAPFFEGAMAAGVQCGLGSTLDEVFHEATVSLRQKTQHFAHQSPGDHAPEPTAAEGVTRRVTMPNPHGLHARPATRLIREAGKFDAAIQVRNLANQRGPASLKSLSGLAGLEILHGHELELSATGPEAARALDELTALIRAGLGDELPDVPSAPQPSAPAIPHDPIPVSSGLALGKLFFAGEREPKLESRAITDVEAETARLRQAVSATQRSLAERQAAQRALLGAAEAAIFEAQSLALEDPALVEAAEHRISEQKQDAATAWWSACREVVAGYRQLTDEYLRQRAGDIREAGLLVLEALGLPAASPVALPEPGLLVVDELNPGEVTELDPTRVLGVICLDGGRTSHATILLRARGVPAIIQARHGLDGARDGAIAAFDGDTGEIWLDPDADLQADLRRQQEVQREKNERLLALGREPAHTKDGQAIAVLANLGHPSEAEWALHQGAEGVGLFRTEFLFLHRGDLPGEEEQFESLRAVGEVMGHRPVVVRTLDAGGDKPVPALGLPPEANPFLGVRALRICLERPDLFRTQLRAILRAAEGHDFHIMFPMVAEPAELLQARGQLTLAHEELTRDGRPHAWPLPVGIMIEIPSAIVLLDRLLPHADFLSIGTNDLAQYAFAADRTNPRLARFQDAGHPAVLRLIHQVTTAARAHNRPVAVCGEAASDPHLARLLVGLGVGELSLSPRRIPQIKAALAVQTLAELEQAAQAAL